MNGRAAGESFSVVVPTWNRTDRLDEAVGSGSLELIVVPLLDKLDGLGSQGVVLLHARDAARIIADKHSGFFAAHPEPGCRFLAKAARLCDAIGWRNRD